MEMLALAVWGLCGVVLGGYLGFIYAEDKHKERARERAAKSRMLRKARKFASE
jgi:hypothetical protein